MRTMRQFRALIVLLAAMLQVGASAQADYPGALWNQADSGNFSVSNRTTTYPILYMIIHIMEGTYSGSISWFKNPASNVSAHYCIRSNDGEITQMVREKDIAYHAGIWSYNTQSIGIEHEATSTSTSWYTDTMYRSSANLTRYATSKYSIPRTRTWIIGHKETGRATSCPGPYWDWTKYMILVQNDAAFVSTTVPNYIAPGSTFPVTVRMQNKGADAWNGTGSDRCLIGTAAASAYYVAGNWISTTRAAGPVADTAPDGYADFTFNMKAPSTIGTYTETFQLYRDSIGAFGPTVQVTFNVGSSEIIVDDGSSGFSTTGTWSTGSTAPGRYGTTYRYHNVLVKTADVASWFLNAPADGVYDAYAWWSQGTNRSPKVLYEVDTTRNGKIQVFVDQTTNGGQWNFLGRVRLKQGQGYVRMQTYGSSGGVAIADAVRIVGPLDNAGGILYRR